MNLGRLLALPLLLLATPLVADEPAAPAIAEEDLPLDPRFSPVRVKADIAFLADDLLEGRDTGSRGHEIAALFAAQRFASLGLEPAGDDGTYFQSVPMQKTSRGDTIATMEVVGPDGTRVLTHGKDALIGVSARELDLDVSAPLVFAGYGLANKSLGIDDYAGLDVAGKIVVVLTGFPEGLDSEPAAYLNNTKAEAAEARGAIGLISIPTPVSRKTSPFERSLGFPSRPTITPVGKDGLPLTSAPGIRAGASVGDEGAQVLLAGGAMTLAQIDKQIEEKGGAIKGFALPSTVRIRSTAVAETITSVNVAAILPGSDPELAAQHVVLSGHLDHLGTRERKEGEGAEADLIYNGALDNAAGSATLLEVARVFSEDAVKPRRSLLFLLVTAEEKGLKGAQYFAANPTVPASSIVGNVNLDMPLLVYPFQDIVAFGAEHSTIGRAIAQAVAPMGLALAPDPFPEQNIFVRSDHYMFVREGIPAVMLFTGMANGGEPQWTKFFAEHYHREGDDLSQPINYRAGARFAEVNYRIAQTLANAEAQPMWYADDFFGDIFAPAAKKAPAP